MARVNTARRLSAELRLGGLRDASLNEGKAVADPVELSLHTAALVTPVNGAHDIGGLCGGAVEGTRSSICITATCSRPRYSARILPGGGGRRVRCHSGARLFVSSRDEAEALITSRSQPPAPVQGVPVLPREYTLRGPSASPGEARVHPPDRVVE
jgi:hypothetical protein